MASLDSGRRSQSLLKRRDRPSQAKVRLSGQFWSSLCIGSMLEKHQEMEFSETALKLNNHLTFAKWLF